MNDQRPRFHVQGLQHLQPVLHQHGAARVFHQPHRVLLQAQGNQLGQLLAELLPGGMLPLRQAEGTAVAAPVALQVQQAAILQLHDGFIFEVVVTGAFLFRDAFAQQQVRPEWDAGGVHQVAQQAGAAVVHAQHQDAALNR